MTLDESRTVERENPPATMLANAPTEWYELQPDLDVAWYSTDGESWLCFRSPTGQECHADNFAPTEFGGDGPILVGTGGGQALIVTMEPGEEITLTLSSGTTHQAPVCSATHGSTGESRKSNDR